MTIFYQCNPELFEKCKKTHCQEECTLTTFKEYAKTDEFGNPIMAAIDDLSNEELPKHGRLIDADKLPYEDIESIDGNTYMCVNAYDIEHAPTIIEADKGGRE